MADSNPQPSKEIASTKTSEVLPSEALILSHKRTRMQGISEQWASAWAEFCREYPGMLRLSGGIATVLFTGLGASVLGLILLVYPYLPRFAWPLIFLSTIVLAQMFVINFSASAMNRKIATLEERLQPNLTILYTPNKAPFMQICDAVSGLRSQSHPYSGC